MSRNHLAHRVPSGGGAGVPVIETRDLCRTYQTYVKPEGFAASVRGFWKRDYREKKALRPTNLKIYAGEIVGLVGANGAGKTTLLKLLSGLVHPTSGTASVLGYEPWQRHYAYLKRMSILLGQKNQLWWDLAPLDSYALLCEIYDLDRTAARARVRELAEIFECTSVLETQLRRLSLGERMKMEIIGALLHEPDILFLDEPTIGLDIVAQTGIRNFISKYAREKRPTIILTSHYMDDITSLADRLLLISRGEIVYDGTVEGFTAQSSRKKQIEFALREGLSQPTRVGHVDLSAKVQDFTLTMSDDEIAVALPQILQLPGMHQLRVTERDFQDVIREFLQKESSLFQTSRPQQS